MTRSITGSVIVLTPLLILAGCGAPGSDRPATVPTTATVTYQGKPAEAATVVFSPEGGQGTPAMGTTDSSGVAELKTFETGDGAVPGSYKVTVRKIEGAIVGEDFVIQLETPEDEEEDDEGDEEGAEAKNLLPAKYASAGTTDLSATVEDGKENAFTFELTD